MIVSWNWLKEHVPLRMPLGELTERLTLSGLNFEGDEDVGGDIAIDLEVTSNRPDCLGHVGVAREIAALYDIPLTLPPTLPAETVAEDAADGLSVTIDESARDWCPQYTARRIDGVTVGESPDWMKTRLRTLGVAPVNNVVDVTNYVMLETGQPLHAFDADKLAGGIVVRNARKGETLEAINHKTYELLPWMNVIADDERPVALAGVMGGASTEIGAGTTSVLLESAEFLPLPIRRMARRLDLDSDSSYRFERKVDPGGIARASDRACRLLADLCGGKPAAAMVRVGSPSWSPEPVTLRMSRLEQVLGLAIPKADAVRLLESIGLDVTEEGDVLHTTPPSFRRDLTREIDLIEEVGRLYGYEHVPEDAVLPVTVSPTSDADRLTAKVRDTLMGGGFCEAVTFSFASGDAVASVRPWTDSKPHTLEHSSRKLENRLRQSVLPSLLRAFRFNEARDNDAIHLFEIASVYLPGDDQAEPSVLALVSQSGDREVRGLLDALFARLGVSPDFAIAEVPGLEVGKTAEYLIVGERVGVFGYASAAVRDALDIRRPVTVAEFRLDRLLAASTTVSDYRPLPDQPASARDLAFILDESVRWERLETVVRAASPPELERLEFVDLYRGKQAGAGNKSIALRLTFRADGRTLTGSEVTAWQDGIVAAVTDQLGGQLRDG